MLASTTTSASYTVTYPGLPAPTFNPPAGTYSNNQTVTVTSGAGSTIWYTTDGSAPVVGTSASIPSGGTISLSGSASGSVAVNAVASESTFNNSPTVTASYTFQAAPPVASAGSGLYNNNLSVSLSTTTTGATIYYTTDGTTPTTSSTAYTGPIAITASTTLNAIAVKAGYLNSPVTGNVYTLQAATPTFSAAGGTYNAALTVTISDVTAGASIYYTTNGTTPTTSSTPYAGPISLLNGYITNLQAIAVNAGYNNSIVDSVSYTVLVTPTGLATGTATGSSISVSWSAVPLSTSFTQYVIVRGTEPTFAVSPYYLYSTGTSITDSNLSPSTQYYYKIEAQYGSLYSSFSGSVNGYTLTSTGDPVVATQSIASYTPPSGYLPYYFTSSGGTTQTGPVLRDGGYTYVCYSWDTVNDLNSLLVVFNSSGQYVTQYPVTGVRYVYQITASGGIVSITGQGGTTVTVYWTAIPP